jgi:Glycogen recognition site of AMP-activated protein kinase
MRRDELQALLDGEIDPARARQLLAALPEAERREALALLAIVRTANAEPRPTPSPGFAERTMAQVRSRRPPRPSLSRWLLLPRVSPLGALAGAAAAAFLALAVARFPAPARGSAPETARVVRLVLAAPDARVVRVAGDFNGWHADATPLRRGPDGRWTVELPLDSGRYQYMFVVDGRWVTDPSARARADDGFGGENAILEL